MPKKKESNIEHGHYSEVKTVSFLRKTNEKIMHGFQIKKYDYQPIAAAPAGRSYPNSRKQQPFTGCLNLTGFGY